jgi:DNA replication and repair protein RecF
MKVQSLELEHFRSFRRARFSFGAKTVVIGRNGAGKSNLVEAIRLLSVGKSIKTSRLDEVISFEQPYFRLTLTRSNSENQEVVLFYGIQFEQSQAKERRLQVGGKEIGYQDFWGQFPSVLFVPDDLEIVLGPPATRRRYLDSVIWQTDKEFRQSHLELSKVLRERSALLFLIKTNRAAREEMRPWDELLNDLSQKIRARRRRYVDFLGSEIGRLGPAFAVPAEIKVSYQENRLQPAGAYAEEVRLSQNLVGPQRDELRIDFGGRTARHYTSRGQARAIVLTLKIAETAFLEQETGQAPLLLLDDMFSELDQPTAAALFERFSDQAQIIATSITPNALVEDWERLELK